MFPNVVFHLEVVEECASTQQLLIERRDSADFHGTAILAIRQTAGVGRRGREWSSREGNLALSFGLELKEETLLPLILFASGLALYRTVKPHLPREADLCLKWPNDLYLDGKKLAGMIAQGRFLPGRGSDVVVGVGLNLAWHPEGLDPPATSLVSYGVSLAPVMVASVFLQNLSQSFQGFDNFNELKKEWETCAHLGEHDLFVMGEAEPVFPLGLLPSGELLVRTQNKEERRLSSEEVSLRFR